MSTDDAELVESGGFRIDRKRALKKLSAYQLPAPERGVFFWVRAAVAAGAKNLEVRHGAGFLEIRYDGKPFAKGELRDPYGGLFYGDDPRRRHLALGLLWLVRSGAVAITVSSGGRRLSVESLEKDSVGDSPLSKGWTVVSARWGGLLRLFRDTPWKRSPAEYGTRCAMSGIEIKVSGRAIVEDPFSGRGAVHDFHWKGARVRMSYWNAAENARSAVDLSVLGVRADSIRYAPQFVPCWSLADSPHLELDASQFKAVKNGNLDALLERIAREEKQLLERMLDACEAGGGDRALYDGLQESCWMLLKSPQPDSKNALLRRLWDAPLIRWEAGGACSLRDALRFPDRRWFPEERDHRKFRSLAKRAR